MKRGEARPKRGRPPKFGRRGRVVAITLPEEAIRRLKRVNADLAWAIVQLLQERPRQTLQHQSQSPDSELVSVADGRSLIVVNRDVFKELPGINMIPLHGDRAFLALDRDASVADLELAVVDRMATRSVGARERSALAELRAHLRTWRRDPALRCHIRSIVVIDRARRGHRTPDPARGRRLRE
jgi:hypothetical protein